MSELDELERIKYPDPEVFDDLASVFEEWGSRHQDFLQRLKTGHEKLQENWEGDGIVAYTLLHAQAHDLGQKHIEKFQRVSSGLRSVSRKTSSVRSWIAGAIATIGAAMAGTAATLGVTGPAGIIALAGEAALLAILTGLFVATGSQPQPTPAPPTSPWKPTPVPPPPPVPQATPLPRQSPNDPSFYLGDISSPNPIIWLYKPSGTGANAQYVISTNMPPGNPGDWVYVNQFGSLLSTQWLLNPNHPSSFTLSDIYTNQQQLTAMTMLLSGQDQDLQSQMKGAEQALGGQQQSRNAVVGGIQGGGDPFNLSGSYPVGTKIWAGNECLTIAIYIDSDTTYTVYDPHTGQTKTYQRSHFSDDMSSGAPYYLKNFVVKTP